ncbi:MAG TPA: 16S rRNA (cytosine(967)-C(5))-methyltransferase RsmB [Syntrophales bacterium]|nr:16S rRNA (cytosine(967)-C(5))-methyltransferase RsmB [Syntrophales bacterium]
MNIGPRGTAVEILNEVDRGAFAEPLLDRSLSGGKSMGPRDRGLLTMLVYGTLRMRGRLDWNLRRHYRADYDAMETGIRNILRIGAYQAMFMDRVPDYAVVSESVETARRMFPGREGLVNGVLRGFLRGKGRRQYPDPENEPAAHISAFHSHPLWLVEKWIERYGVSETRALCEADNGIPPCTVRVNRLRAERKPLADKLRSAGMRVFFTPVSPDGLILEDAEIPLRESSFVRTGSIQVQDEASQMISVLTNPPRGGRVLDLCSGIGGKTAHLAEIMGNEGEIAAADINRGKLNSLRRIAGRLGISIVKTFVRDAAQDLGSSFHGGFDRVLVDAPCSGTGTLRRNPEIKWRLRPEDIPGLQSLQTEILGRAALYPRKGGLLVYSTCSLLSEENEDVVSTFLSRNGSYRPVAPHHEATAGLIGPDLLFRTFPHRGGMDGFFAAVMERIN